MENLTCPQETEKNKIIAKSKNPTKDFKILVSENTKKSAM